MLHLHQRIVVIAGHTLVLEGLPGLSGHLHSAQLTSTSMKA